MNIFQAYLNKFDEKVGKVCRDQTSFPDMSSHVVADPPSMTSSKISWASLVSQERMEWGFLVSGLVGFVPTPGLRGLVELIAPAPTFLYG